MRGNDSLNATPVTGKNPGHPCKTGRCAIEKKKPIRTYILDVSSATKAAINIRARRLHSRRPEFLDLLRDPSELSENRRGIIIEINA